MKGQISFEMLIVIILVMLFFVATLIVSGSRRTDLNDTSETISSGIECEKLSGIINSVQTNTELRVIIRLEKNLSINNGEITIGENFCLFLGKSQDVNLVSGLVEVYNEAGVVKFDQP